MQITWDLNKIQTLVQEIWVGPEMHVSNKSQVTPVLPLLGPHFGQQGFRASYLIFLKFAGI